MKRTTTLLSLLLIIFWSIHAQTTSPQFRDGDKALNEFIYDNLSLPAGIKVKGTKPVVQVKFLVSNSGEIKYAHIISPKRSKYDSEVLKMIKLMPNWIPASRKGKNISLYKTLSVDFNKLGSSGTLTIQPVDEKGFIGVEQMPSFPGGESEMMKFISTNLKYPVIAMENGIEGKVIVGFTVKKDGSISNALVLRGLDPSCDREALRVVRMMPKWIPAKQNGQPAEVSYSIPVRYKLLH